MAMINRPQRDRSDQKQPTRYYSKKQEDAIAKRFGGSRVKNSGATQFAKGDVSLDNILLEAKTKTTNASSITIQKEWLLKNDKEALFMGKPYSALAFNFGPNENNYYIINEEMFELLLNYIGGEDT